MERIYLVAALAVTVTFAGMSRGFQSLQQLSLKHGQSTSGQQCSRLPAIVGRMLAKLDGSVRQTDPEEEQLLAEMNLPIAAMEAKAAEQAAKQSEAAAERASAAAMREAERAHRDAIRMRQEMALQKNMGQAVSIDLRGLDGLDQRMQVRAVAMAQRFAEQSARMQVAAARWQAASWQVDNSGKRHLPCGTKRAEMR